MSRAMHRHRHIRLTTTRQILAETRIRKGPAKIKERARRDVKIVAAIKATKGDAYSPAVKSWITAQLEKQWRQVTKDDIKALIA